MVKKRILDPIPILDEALLLKALREEGIKEVSISHTTTLNLSHRSFHNSKQRTQAIIATLLRFPLQGTTSTQRHHRVVPCSSTYLCL